MDLEGVTLNEIRQAQENKSCTTSLICGIKKRKTKQMEKTKQIRNSLLKTENNPVVAGGAVCRRIGDRDEED